MIGGTVAGFINNYGCFTRGATALAVYSKDMDVAVGYGKNTKGAPHLAAKKCAEMIRRGLKKSKFTNKLFISLISGPIIPKFPIIGYKNVITSPILGELLTQLLWISHIMGTGVSREEEVLTELDYIIKDGYLIGCSLMDDGQFFENYQFYNNKLLTNSLVLLGILAKDVTFHLGSAHGHHPTGLKFKITGRRYNGKVLSKLNGKPATTTIFNSLKWVLPMDEEFGRVEKLYQRFYYYPLGIRIKDNYCPKSIGAVLGENILLGTSIDKDIDEVEVLIASGENILNAVDHALASVPSNDILAGFLVSCAVRLSTLGKEIYNVYKKLINFFKDAPFILVYGAGEDIHIPNDVIYCYNVSFNVLIFKG